MKNQIDITNPCHEKWSNMQANDQGAFCSVCNKNVIDFTSKNRTQIRDFFKRDYSTEPVCGKFKKEQLLELNFDAFFSRFRLWALARRCAVIIFLAVGTMLFSCGTDPIMGEMEPVGKVAVHDSLTTSSNDSVTVNTEQANQ